VEPLGSGTSRRRWRLALDLAPAQTLTLGFLLATLAGATLLSLPAASQDASPVSFLDAWFTAASAITTTGLVVADTGRTYSLFGELVILIWMQVGGLGYMLFIAHAAFLLGRRPSLRAGLLMRESIAGTSLGRLREFFRAVLIFTIVFEVVGTAALTVILSDRLPLGRAAYVAVFHSVSAFCAAGFTLFTDSFIGYAGHLPLNAVIAVLTLAGGIGFFVLYDLASAGSTVLRRAGRPRLSVHTKLALTVQFAIISLASLLVFASQPHPGPLRQQLMEATFQAIMASTTTGFNTVVIAAMAPASLFALILVMFVGAGPGGTAGGMKVTAFGVVLASVLALLRGGQDTVVFKRRIPLDTVLRALTIGMLATVVVVTVTLILVATERAGFLSLLFETVSALSSGGLSMGPTSGLSPVGKVALSLTMLSGRVGPLAVGFALVGRPRRTLYRFVEGEVYVG
jgi:trk system potassium uptake protein TrkH